MYGPSYAKMAGIQFVNWKRSVPIWLILEVLFVQFANTE